jgi:peptide/nickel transport system permease protein
MGRYLARRLTLIAPTVLAASVVVFLVLRVLPGDVALVILSGSPHTIEVREALREELGLNDPLPVQYGRWLWSMLNGEFGGRSLESRESVRSILARQLPVTLLLAGYAVLLTALLSVPLGVLAAVHANRWPDRVIRVATLGGLALPHVWVALLIILGLLLLFRWSPPIIYTSPRADLWNHLQIMIWPALLLSWEYGSHIVRVLRASLLEVLNRDYITVARSKGLRERTVIMKYALRNAVIPTVTMIGLQFGTLLSGALVLETIFGLPGMGRGLIQAALARDYPVVQSIATLLVLFYLVVNLLVDVLNTVIDPRISHSEG